MALVLSKELFHIQATIECRFTQKQVRQMITCSQMHRTDKYSQHSFIFLASLARWLSVPLRTKTSDIAPVSNKEFYGILGTIECRFTLKRVGDIITYSPMHHRDKYSQHSSMFLASLAKWLSVRLWTKCLWIWIPLLSLKLQISRLFQARSSLAFRHRQSVDSLGNTYVTW